MADEIKKFKIKIQKDGPYIVSGNIPITEKTIVPNGLQYEYKDGKALPQSQVYALCRCGKSKNPPFCDGSHIHEGFDGTETASRDNFIDRAAKIEGPEMTLLDDQRCAFAKLCHKEDGKAWRLTKQSDNPKYKQEAVEGASNCPAGRLLAVDHDGTSIENVYEPSIEILYDEERRVNGPIFVKGGIPIESSDGYVYEVRNRATLCRCGKSQNKPFCDAKHASRR